jgi:hypothetical protein
VLTNHLAGALCPSRPLARIRIAIMLSAAALTSVAMTSVAATSAGAGGVGGVSCLGDAPRSFNCAGRWDMAPGDPYIRFVPEPGEAQKSAFKERDRKWLAHCRPVVERDVFGVARYHYAARGCEFGVGED